MLHILFHIAFVFSILLLFRINKWLSLIGRRQFFGRTCKRKRKKQQQKTDFNDLTAFSHIYLLNNNKFCLHNNQNIQEYSINHLNNMIMLSCLFFKIRFATNFESLAADVVFQALVIRFVQKSNHCVLGRYVSFGF